MVSVEIAVETMDAFVSRGWLSEDEAKDTRMVSNAASDLIECWARGTLFVEPICHAATRDADEDLPLPVESVAR